MKLFVLCFKMFMPWRFMQLALILFKKKKFICLSDGGSEKVR